MPSKRQIVRSSMVVGFFSLLGSLTGILVETSIAAKLGLSRGSDTFYVAFTVPYIITTLLYATGQFSLVPFFGTLEARHSTEELWRGFSYALNAVLSVMGTIALLGAAAAPWIVRGIAPGFTAAQTETATQLGRWLFLLIVPAGAAEVFRSFLLSQRRFALPSAAGFFRNTVVIAGVIGAFSRLGYYSIVLGYLAGYTLQFCILGVQILISFPARYTLTLRGSGEAFRNLRGAGGAQLGGALAWQVVVVVERIIASFLPAGTLTALNYGMKIMSTVSELLGGSVGTATLPALSRAVARKAQPEARKIFQDTLEISLVFILPASVFCVLLHHDIIKLVFERGHFTADATALLGMVFLYYSLCLLPYSSIRALTFYFFARHEGGLYFRLTALQYGLTLAFDLFYVGVLRMGAKGIPLGFLSAALLTMALAYHRNLAELKVVLDRSLAWFAVKNLAAASLTAALVLGLRFYLHLPQTTFESFLYLCILCGAGSLAFFAVLAVTRAVPVAQMLAELKGAEDA